MLNGKSRAVGWILIKDATSNSRLVGDIEGNGGQIETAVLGVPSKVFLVVEAFVAAFFRQLEALVVVEAFVTACFPWLDFFCLTMDDSLLDASLLEASIGRGVFFPLDVGVFEFFDSDSAFACFNFVSREAFCASASLIAVKPALSANSSVAPECCSW